MDFLMQTIKGIMTTVYASSNVRADPTRDFLEYCPVMQNPDGSRYFVFLFRRYNFDDKQQLFVPGTCHVGTTFADLAPTGIVTLDDLEVAYEKAIQGSDPDPPESAPCRHAHDQIDRFKYRIDSSGLNDQEVASRRSLVGPNKIEMTRPTLMKSLQKEIAKPFYLYQFYILWVWMTLQYWYMACVNWSIIWITACIVSWFRFQGTKVLYGISKVEGETTVLRNHIFVSIDQTDLVPGDIVLLSPGVSNCDLVLLTGEAVVEESALTGEASPQAKIPIDPRSEETYEPKNHRRHTIFAGTKIFECESALALVTRTASYTAKGELLREIIAFRQHTSKYESELPFLVGILCLCSVIYLLLIMFNSNAVPVVSWTLGMSAFSSTFPALLPITFSVPVGVSMNRLAKQHIACTNSDSILIAGKVKKAFFDKTGTLTMQGLDYISCRSAESWDSGQWSSDTLELAMATCHSLTKSQEGELIGNPVDRAMFLASHGKLVNVSGVSASVRDKHGKRHKVVRRFDFDHNKMTQCVVVRLEDHRVVVFLKGSGESVSRLCNKASIPESYYSKLRNYSRSGFYQIAVAFKELPMGTVASSISRTDIEQDLNFVGVLNFSNRLRPETPDVVQQLADAEISSVMVTGDNLHTGIYIARMCLIIPVSSCVNFGVLDADRKLTWLDDDGNIIASPCPDELGSNGQIGKVLAMSGEAWYSILNEDPAHAVRLAPHIRVFGRCSPQDKVSVIDTFANMGYITLMCGDGGNDCGALKAAHVGLALSDSDASLVAPFTSLNKEIQSVLTLLKEGRASLASTMAAYKYVILYGQISSYNQVIMYKLSVSFSDWMWTFMDGFWTVTFSLTLPLALPAVKLAKTRPTASILGKHTISSVTGIVLLDFLFMAIALATLFSQDWYQCRKWNVDFLATGDIFSSSDNYETEVVFLITGFQCISAAMTCNFGYEFRRHWLRNWIFVLFASVFTFVHFYITLVPSNLSCLWRVNCMNDNVVRSVTDPEPYPINNPYNTTVMPTEFRWKLLCIMIGNGLTIAAYDYFIVNGLRRHQWAAKQILNKVFRRAEQEDDDKSTEEPSSQPSE